MCRHSVADGSECESESGGVIEHVGILRECLEAKVSANLEMMAFQQEIQHALILNDPRSACELCLSESPPVKNLTSHGCLLEDISQVAVGSFLDSVLVLATSGLSTREQQRQPPGLSATKLAMVSIIETMRSYAEQTTFVVRRA